MRVALVPCLAAVLVIASPLPAAAEEPAGVTPIGHVTLDIAPNATNTGFIYCISGSVSTTGRITGDWTVRVSGIRGTTLYTPPDIHISSANYNNGCPTISTDRTANGFLAISVSYLAVGGSVIAHSSGLATWTTIDGYHATSVDLTP
ncbi:MAG TPA: hypothetical protein VNQ77_17605 [Frankiaceae bacterium]|nr:hypothetical protein [Frankiaceae bacterium]